jgi:hypothetical protein
MKIYSFLLALIVSCPVFSITPGKWSHTDSLLLFPDAKKSLPKRETVEDAKGNTILVSEFQYKDNLLRKETYLSKGRKEGWTDYEYSEGKKLIREIRSNSQGKIQETKEYFYGKSGILNKIKIYDEDGNLYMETSVLGMDRELIKLGEVHWKETGDKEKLHLEGNAKRKLLTVSDEKKKPIATVEYLFDPQGFLIERNFKQSEIERKHTIERDSEGKILKMLFHVKQDGKWALTQTHSLTY